MARATKACKAREQEAEQIKSDASVSVQEIKEEEDPCEGEVSEVLTDTDEVSCSEEEEDLTNADLVNQMYELFTSTQGVNVTEALLQIKESLDKTNKILFKILGVASTMRASS